ncbi:MAG: hypothetical protein WC992_02350 [Acholeplasmataceae bacterium]
MSESAQLSPRSLLSDLAAQRVAEVFYSPEGRDCSWRPVRRLLDCRKAFRSDIGDEPDLADWSLVVLVAGDSPAVVTEEYVSVDQIQRVRTTRGDVYGVIQRILSRVGPELVAQSLAEGYRWHLLLYGQWLPLVDIVYRPGPASLAAVVEGGDRIGLPAAGVVVRGPREDHISYLKVQEFSLRDACRCD